MSSKKQMQTQNRKGGLLDGIMAKYKKCNDSCYLQIAINHLKTYESYLKAMNEKGAAAFGNRQEYQKFEVAKLFIDRIDLLDFTLDPSFKGYNEYKDKEMPPLDAFSMTPDIKETRKIKFCRNIEKGDILHLRVVEETETEYKLLVINKYDENERVVDYLIHAYMMKSYQLNKLPRPMKINDYVRAAVLGKLKMEENVFSKLLVTLNNNFVNEKYKDVELGLIFKSDIPFYPEDISNHSSFINYMKAEKKCDDPEEVLKCMTSLGLNPFKTYSFDASQDNKKLGKPKEIDSNSLELRKMEESMNKIREAEKQILQGMELRAVVPMIEEALEIYPQNDAAYAIRGQLWNRLSIEENNQDLIKKAMVDCMKALEINPYNLTATRVYLTVLYFSAESFKEESNKEKADEIGEILAKCKHICDISELLHQGNGKEDTSEQSPIEEAQNGVVPMDLSEG